MAFFLFTFAPEFEFTAVIVEFEFWVAEVGSSMASPSIDTPQRASSIAAPNPSFFHIRFSILGGVLI